MKLKKFISLLLVLVLLTSPIVALASLVPETENAPYATPATTDPGDTFATPGTTEPPEDETIYAPITRALATNKLLSAVPVGDTVKINVNGAAYEFIVVHHGKPSSIYDDSFNNGVILLMKDVYEERRWNSPVGNSYADSETHSNLNSTFLNLIDADIRNQIKQVKVPYRAGFGAGNTVTSGEYGLSCKVFLLSGYEVGWTSANNYYLPADGAKFAYFDAGTGASANNKRIAYLVTAKGWWLRSPHTESAVNAKYVHTDGSMGNNIEVGDNAGKNVNQSTGIRPALVLPNTANVDSSGFVVFDSAPTTPASITVPSSITYNTAYTVSWGAATSSTGTFGGYKLERQINGGTWTQIYQGTATSFSQTLTRDQATTVNYRVKAYSPGGLESGYVTGTARTVTNNRVPTAPTGMTAPSSVNSWASSTAAFSWNASTDGDSDSLTYAVEIAVNGGAWTQVQNTSLRTYTRTISIPNDTYYQARVRAYDGREYSAYLTSSIVPITHDTTKPTIQVVAVPDNTSYAKDKVEITVMVSDGGSGLNTLTVPPGVTPSGNQTLSGATATKTFTATANGTYTFVVTDKANLSASGSASPSKIDGDNPTITYTTNPPNGEYTNGDVEITLTFSDATSGLAGYSGLNGAEGLSGNIATRSFTAGANGVYPFSVTDIVGHATSMNVPIDMIDRFNPSTSIAPRIQSWTNAASAWFDVTATDDYSGINKIILPDGSEHSGAATAYEIFENGSYSAYSLDKATNPSSVASANYTWFDRTKPTVRSVAFVPSTNFIAKWFSDLLGYNQHVRIEATGDDTPEGSEGESGIVSTHYRVLDGNGGVVEDWTQVPYGTKPTIDYDIHGSVEIYFKDAAGNPSDTESHEILVDLTPPVISYTLSTEDETTDPVTVTLTITDDGSGAKGFLLPDGNIFAAQAQITYTFDENDIKYFTGYDRSGRFTEIAVEVSNIVPHPLEGDWEDNQVVIDAVLHATGKRRITDVTHADMQKIIYLDLSSNQLTSLPDILANAQNLEHLSLRGNEFEKIPDFVFDFPRLRYLDASNNNIREISDRIRDLPLLETFDARFNYLTDYSLPAIIPNYYDEGNFTLNGADGQYSFRFLEYDYPNEPIGNTAQLSVEWSYGGAAIGGSLEDHRKELYKSFYPLYRTYRPMLYSYTVNNGQFKTGTPDYVQLVLLNNEPASATIRLGAAS